MSGTNSSESEQYAKHYFVLCLTQNMVIPFITKKVWD